MTEASHLIPRSALRWLLIVQFLVILPHVTRLPWWVLLLWLVCALWRVGIYGGRAKPPSRFVRLVLVLICSGGIAYQFNAMGGLNFAAALLVLAFTLKLIEIRRRRDLLLVLYLAYFVAGSAFLFSQSFFLAVYVLLVVVVITAALAGMQRTDFRDDVYKPLVIAGKIVLQSLPLMMVLFVIFPRIPPLWAVGQVASAKMGMSQLMSPGDIAKLGKSDEVVFRAVFDGVVPERSQLYWRGMTFSYYDGRQWATSDEFSNEPRHKSWHQLEQYRDDLTQIFDAVYSYEVVLEPHGAHWLFALPVADIDFIDDNSENSVFAVNDFSLMASKPINQRVVYRVNSFTQYVAEPYLPSWRRDTETNLPVGVNPKSNNMAQMWRQEVTSDAEYVERVLTWFRQEAFFYTLNPPLLGKDSVDEFLFVSRRGFCEHYAGAFTYLMRAAGIPARIVAGYQGGEFNELNNSVTVHQFDAHAWAEVWLAGRGWVRVDPTGAVAPSRVLSSLEDALSDRNEFMQGAVFSSARYRNLQWVNWMRMRADLMNYQWHRLVLGFDDEQQLSLLSRLLGKVTSLRVALLFLGVMALVLTVVGLQLLRHRVKRHVDKPTRLYLRFCQRLERIGIKRRTGEGIYDFAARVGERFEPLSNDVDVITALYGQIAYQNDRSSAVLDDLKGSISSFRPQKQLRKHKI